MSDLTREELLARNEQLEADLANARWRERQQQLSAPRQMVRVIPQGVQQGPIAIPTTAEMLSLRDIVLAKYPQLSPEEMRITPERWLTEFCCSFEALGYTPRQSTPNNQYYISFWIDHCEEISRRIGLGSVTLTKGPFLAAVLGWSDIAHDYLTAPNNPHQSVSIGLAVGTGRLADVDSWRKVLATKALLSPTRTVSQSNSKVGKIQNGFAG